MAHRDPMLAVRSKLEARERELSEAEAELAEAHGEIARHKVRIDELVVAQHRVAATEPAPARSGWLAVALVVGIAGLGVSTLVGAGVVAAFVLRPAPVLVEAPVTLQPYAMEPLPVAAPTIADAMLTSEPEGAEVWIDGVRVGTTPYALERTAGEPALRVELRAAGYAPAQVSIGSRSPARIRAELTPESDMPEEPGTEVLDPWR